MPRLGADFFASSLEVDFVYAASGCALVSGARLKLGTISGGAMIGYVVYTYSLAFCDRLVCL